MYRGGINFIFINGLKIGICMKYNIYECCKYRNSAGADSEL